MNNKKILALDLDETLLSTDKTISQKNIDALEKYLDLGHYLAIDTGRPIHGIKKLLGPYSVFSRENVFFLGYQGVVGYNPSKDTKMYTDYVDSNKAVQIFELIEKKGHTALAFDEKLLYCVKENSNVVRYNMATNEPVEAISGVNELLEKNICKCMAVNFDNPDSLLELQEEIAPLVGDDFTIMFSTPFFLEFVKKGASKGHGLRLLADYLEVPMENTVACGDERNDISMIKAAGVGVAVNNAREEVKAVADYVTEATNDEGAIAEAIFKFLI